MTDQTPEMPRRDRGREQREQAQRDHPERANPVEEHEGAVADGAPGAPSERPVIKPGWAELDAVLGPEPEDPEALEPADEPPGPGGPGRPAIDRHR